MPPAIKRSMPKVLFVAGLPGSGKTGYLDTLASEGFQRFDDFKANAIGNSSAFRHSCRFHELVRVLRDGHNCAIADIDFCRSEARAEAANVIRNSVPGVVVEWHYFENAVEQCRLNIQARSRDSMERELRKLDEFTLIYSPPKNGVLLRVWRAKTPAEPHASMNPVAEEKR